MTGPSFEQISALAPAMKPQYRAAFQSRTVLAILGKYEIADSPLRVCHFIAQVFAETGALTALVESLNYSASRLEAVWPKRFRTLADAQPYAHNEEALGNFVYGGRMGNIEAGDGYRYRGRGLLQITGRSAYARYGSQLGIDLVGDPDQAFSSAHCLEVAAVEWAASGWSGRSCNQWADEDNIEGVTTAINGGLNGMVDRREWLNKAKQVWLDPTSAVAQLSSRAIANLDLPDDGAKSALHVSPDLLAQAPVTSTFDGAKATLLGQFIAAAYAMHDAEPNSLTPNPVSLPSGYRVLAAIQMQDFVLFATGAVFYGLVAQSVADPNRFVVAFRGTSGWEEWWDDVNAAGLQPFRTPGCGSVGIGFARIYDTIEVVEYPSASPTGSAAPRSLKAAGSLSRQIADLVTRHAPQPSPTAAFAASASVSVTGHSLGGALTTLYVMENAKAGQIRNPLICTFASPRVGDATFVAAFNALGLVSWRVANTPDLVPGLPPESFGFEHVGALHAVTSTGKVKASIGCWHALSTYLSLIDTTLQPDADCRVTSAATQFRRAPSVVAQTPAAANAKQAADDVGLSIRVDDVR
jgi:predicted chitinase